MDVRFVELVMERPPKTRHCRKNWHGHTNNIGLVFFAVEGYARLFDFG